MSMVTTDKYLKEVLTEYCDEKIIDGGCLDDIEVSDDFKRNMASLVKSVDKRQRSNSMHSMRWAAAVVAVLVIAATLIVGLDNDAQAGCFDFIKKLFTGGFDQYQVVSDTDNDEREIIGFTMNYIPEGYKLVKEETPNNNYAHYMYKNENASIYFIYYSDAQAVDTLINNEYTEHSTIKLEDGTRCEYYTDDESDYANCLLWKKENYVCYLTSSDGNKTTDLVKIANNITPKYR